MLMLSAEATASKLLRRFGIRVDGVDTWRFGHATCANDVSRVLAEPTALWMTRYRPSDRKLVFVERPIDALSYQQANDEKNAFYIATGSLLPRQRQLIVHTLRELPPGITVVLAFGDDDRGRGLATTMQGLTRGLRTTRHCPTVGSSWNDEVRAQDCRQLAGHVSD